MTPLVRVVKLGGSLLDWPEMIASLRVWLARQPAAANILIVGGGEFVEKLRVIERAHPLLPEATHWLAIRAMSLSAAIVSEQFPEAKRASSLEQLRLNDEPAPQILDVERFLREDRDTAHALPENWDVTSDSIAARVAQVLNACELVLLKSALPRGELSRESLARLGYVDAYFPRASKGRNVRAINLRDAGFPQVVL